MSRAVLTHGLLARALALCCVAALVACNDTLRPDTTGSIALHVVLGDQPAASAVGTRSPAMTQGHLQSATATATNGSTTKTITLSGGTSTANFTGTITNLPVGTYTVTVEGFVGGLVDYFGQTTGVSVTAGATATPTVTFSSFVPSVTVTTAQPTWLFTPAVTITPAANATSYIIEADKSSSFTSPQKISTTVTGTSAYATVSDTGTWYVRARAVNATVPSGGNASPARRSRSAA